MAKHTRFVGLDVHSETIAVAIAEASGEVRSLGMIPNEGEAIRKLVKKLQPVETLKVCYEAGPCGYVVYWQLAELGVHCEVVAPTLVPMRTGDRVKTDRRDAAKLARCCRAGELTPVWVPDAEHEALRDLILREVQHARERVESLEAAIDLAVTRLPSELRTLIHALQALRGVKQLTATTIAAETGPLSRFAHPRQLMAYAGVVPSEHSRGGKIQRGTITKTGNAHLRRVVIEAA